MTTDSTYRVQLGFEGWPHDYPDSLLEPQLVEAPGPLVAAIRAADRAGLDCHRIGHWLSCDGRWSLRVYDPDDNWLSADVRPVNPQPAPTTTAA